MSTDNKEEKCEACDALGGFGHIPQDAHTYTNVTQAVSEWEKDFLSKESKLIKVSVTKATLLPDGEIDVKLFIDTDLLVEYLRDFRSQTLEEARKICRQIYVDGADWSEWGISDEEAGKEFDEEYSAATIRALKKE